MQDINLKEVKSAHFIGIGGIGMSALARYMLKEGKQVSGSDASDSDLIQALQEEGVEISIGHMEDHVSEDIDLVVYTIAIQHDNPELVFAREHGIPTVSYPEMLGIISKGKYTVAVAGTHGKTTTTAMLSKILLDAGEHPTVVVGSLLDTSIATGPKGGRTNFIHGESELFVVEACEYKRSFLNLSPNILVITNIDVDHLDYYENLEDIQTAFKELVDTVPDDGYIVCDSDDSRVSAVLGDTPARIIDYNDLEDEISLSVPGEHNVSNAQAAVAAAQLLNINRAQAIKDLEDFRGTWRRAEHICSLGDMLVFDDYAHHPTEIKASLKGFREAYPDKHLCVVFQPHLYSRTKMLLDEFVTSFEYADEIIVVPIYAAREGEDPSISSTILAGKIGEEEKNVHHMESFDDVTSYITNNLESNSLVLTMGAGDVFKIAQELCFPKN